MENKLKTLFDYHRFEPSPRLEKLIRNTESQDRRALSDEELKLVNAAGSLTPSEEFYLPSCVTK